VKRPERNPGHRRIGIALILLLTWFGLSASAAVPVMQQQTVMAADATPMSDAVPMLADCKPCMYCYAAPASAVVGFSEPGEPHEPTWLALAETPLVRPQALDSWSRKQSPVPLRIAYCRWRN